MTVMCGRGWRLALHLELRTLTAPPTLTACLRRAQASRPGLRNDRRVRLERERDRLAGEKTCEVLEEGSLGGRYIKLLQNKSQPVKAILRQSSSDLRADDLD